jgi:hypothetical protein
MAKLISDSTYSETFEQALANVAEAGKNSREMTEELKEAISNSQ